MLCANVRGQETPYTRAWLRKTDKGKRVGGVDDNETHHIPLSGYNAYKIINIPPSAEPFSVDLELTRGLTRKGKVLGSNGQPVKGVQCYGLIATWGYIKTLPEDPFEDNLPPGLEGLWPDNESFSSDADGRFEVVGLKRGVKGFIGVEARTRANHRLDTGNVFRNLVLQQAGDVRDLGEVKVKSVPR
jgi:hypothetical protein